MESFCRFLPSLFAVTARSHVNINTTMGSLAGQRGEGTSGDCSRLSVRTRNFISSHVTHIVTRKVCRAVINLHVHAYVRCTYRAHARV